MWSSDPTRFTSQYVDNLLNFEWVKAQSPAGATQWVPKNADELQTVPDAHVKGKMHAPIMFTTDVALIRDPSYRRIVETFRDDPEAFKDAFAKAWFKLIHRDMGPRWRYVGIEVPKEQLTWQDPLLAADYKPIDAGDVAALKKAVLESGLSVPQLVRTAWASASSFRSTDMRGGANGARIRLEPQRQWAVNDPQELAKTLARLEEVRKTFNGGLSDGKRVSLADTIVLAGSTAIEKAAADSGYRVNVPFAPGRVDATQEQTDADSFAVLEPKADGFRNYYGKNNPRSPANLLIDRAAMLDLTVPEMTVLVGGLRGLDANAAGSKDGVFTDCPGTLSNDFFVNLLDMSTAWKQSDKSEGLCEGHDRKTGQTKWTATPVDLIFGSSSEPRAVAEVYASQDGKEKFVQDFVRASTKVMNLDQPGGGQTN